MITITTQPLSLILPKGSTAVFTVVAQHSNVLANLYYQWYKNDQVMQGETNTTLTISNMNTDNCEVYSCWIYDDVDTDMVTSSYASLALSLLDHIELQIKIAILTLTIAGGYNFNWQTVNQPDEAIGDFPRALIVSPAETSEDDPNGPDSQSYQNAVLFVIQIKGNQAWSNNSNFTMRSNLRGALDDLKKLFGKNSSINGSCEVIMYRSSVVVPLNSNDIQRPSHMDTRWLVRYAQDRYDPLTVSSS